MSLWKSVTIFNKEILRNGFSIYRCNRSSRGGGVLIAVSDSIPSRQFDLSHDIEFVAVELLIHPKVILCCCFVPPSCSLNNLSSLLNSLPSDCKLVLTGDFNIPNVNWATTLSATTSFSSLLCDLVFSKNLIQLITHPTHSQGNIINLVLTDSHESLCNITVNATSCHSFSDHFLVTFCLVSDKRKGINPNSTEFFNYVKGDYCNMESYLLHENYDIIDHLIGIDSTWLYSKINFLMHVTFLFPMLEFQLTKSEMVHLRDSS